MFLVFLLRVNLLLKVDLENSPTLNAPVYGGLLTISLVEKSSTLLYKMAMCPKNITINADMEIVFRLLKVRNISHILIQKQHCIAWLGSMCLSFLSLLRIQLFLLLFIVMEWIRCSTLGTLPSYIKQK